MKDNVIPKGAGIVLFNEKDEVLTLLVDEELAKKNGGVLDLPKGAIEKNETVWQCAVRETFEETGINITTANLEWGLDPIIHGNLTMFLARTKEHGSLNRNPKSGIYEHQMLLWDKPSTIFSSLYGYLKPILEQAILTTGIS